jgi:hypothetical protein
MPSDGMSNTERFYNELVAKQLAEYVDKQPKPEQKPNTNSCPYCGSRELSYHNTPLERDLEWVFCYDCGKDWHK